jgi:hypothetical protein
MQGLGLNTAYGIVVPLVYDYTVCHKTKVQERLKIILGNDSEYCDNYEYEW